ncbi:MAG TPA: hypothetical protein VMY18_09620 [Acidobacteriota bacterium]|nr:hypothetical protein [Acidobacteriota bacterium]
MSSEQKDETIQKLFTEQRLRDEESIPTFESILAAREKRARTGLGHVLLKQSRLAIAASLLLVIGIPLLVYLDRQAGPETIQTSLEIMDWESPTDFLLSYSDRPALEMVPTLELDFPAWAEENTIQERN